MNGHWTSQSTQDFVYRISSDFVLQIEKKMDSEPINQSELAERVNATPGRVSQVLRNPGNLTIKTIVEYARALGMKVAIVAYEDGDPKNENGPVNSQIFSACWTKVGKPTDFFSLTESTAVIRNSVPSFSYVELLNDSHKDERFAIDTQLCDLVWQQRAGTPKFLTAGVR